MRFWLRVLWRAESVVLMDRSITDSVVRSYELMRSHFGFLNWWPGDGPLEICLGAILTQNTSWKNVEKALANLRSVASLEDASQLLGLPHDQFESLLVPSGYFRVKSKRVRSFLEIVVNEFGGSIGAMLSGEVADVRRRLLNINGIGPETADSMMLYAGGHHIFVVDAYTRRIFSRHGWCQSDISYDDLQQLCHQSLTETRAATRDIGIFQDFHAQIVMTGKDFCRPRQPDCINCPLHCILPENGPVLDKRKANRNENRE